MQKSIERLNYDISEYKKCGIYLIKNKKKHQIIRRLYDGIF